jgi:2,4-diketo-3-deoxy-L-fuconate hydrolase
MEPLQLVTFEDVDGVRPAILQGSDIVAIPNAPKGDNGLIRLIEDWNEWEGRVRAARDDRGPRVPVSAGRILTPLRYPGKLLIAGSNYRAHVREMNIRGGKDPETMPEQPYLLALPTRHAIVGTFDTIEVPKWASDIDWEIELAIVIGKTARNVAATEALDYVFGFTIMNDVTSRKATTRTDVPFRHDFLSGKGLNTFCPIGPCIVPKEDLTFPLALKLTVNGTTMQESKTDDFVFDVPTTVAYASQRVTLDPGDVISTGTPGGVGAGRGIFLKNGDTMVASISQIGELINAVRM